MKRVALQARREQRGIRFSRKREKRAIDEKIGSRIVGLVLGFSESMLTRWKLRVETIVGACRVPVVAVGTVRELATDFIDSFH